MENKEEVKNKEAEESKETPEAKGKETTTSRLNRAIDVAKRWMKEMKNPPVKPKSVSKDSDSDDKSKEESDDDSKIKQIEDKVAKRKAELQKEIDELTAKKKSLEKTDPEDRESKKRLQEAEKRIAKLEEPEANKSRQEIVTKNEKERIRTYLDEDKDKPRDQRREMIKAELDEWFAEDSVAATEWMQDRKDRREKERNKDLDKIIKKEKSEEFFAKQKESKAKLYAKYPEAFPEKRAAELKSDGKTEDEINDVLAEEFPQYSLMIEIIKSDEEKYISRPDGPELVMREMDKRLKKEDKKDTKSEKKMFTAEEVEKAKKEAIEMERKRLSDIDSEGGSSGTTEGNGSKTKSTPERDYQLNLMRKVGIKNPEEVLDKRLAYRKKYGFDRESHVKDVIGAKSKS